MRLELLSKNLIIMLDEIMKDQSVLKYIQYNTNNTQSSPNVLPSDVFMKKVFPYPFSLKPTEEQRTQLHIHYPDVMFESSENVEDVYVYFDIVVNKNLWLLTESVVTKAGTVNEKQIRPYSIAQGIVRIFKDKNINTLCKLQFQGIQHLSVNEEIDAIRVVAKMTNFS